MRLILTHVLMRFTGCTKTRRLVTNSLIASLCAHFIFTAMTLIIMVILSLIDVGNNSKLGHQIKLGRQNLSLFLKAI